MAVKALQARTDSIPLDNAEIMSWRWVGVAICVAAFLLRLWTLDAHGLWYDEAISVETASDGLNAIFNNRFGWVGNQTPLHYLIVWLTIQPLDPAVTTLLVRLPSALAGVLMVFITFRLGDIFFGRQQAVVAALLVTLSTTALDYSQDIRPYSVTATMVVLAVFCLVKIGRVEEGKPAASPLWWALFVLSTVVAVYNSYTALIMAVPSLMVVFVWAALAWKRANWGWSVAPVSALAGLGVILVPAVFDVLRISGPSVNLGLLSLRGISDAAYDAWTWFMHFGITGQFEALLRVSLLLLIVVGVFFSLYRRTNSMSSGAAAASDIGPRPTSFGLWICLLFMFVPVLELIVYGTTRPALPRYILFVLPFLMLLVANGAHHVVKGLQSLIERRAQGTGRMYASLAFLPYVLLLTVFGFGALNYSTSAYAILADRADLRSAFSLLSSVATFNDVIVIANSPEHGMTVSDLYWKQAPPAPLYNALDPRVFKETEAATGKVYWVMATWDMYALEPYLAQDARWTSRYSNGRVIVLEEQISSAGIVENMAYMSDKLIASNPNDRLALSMRGSVHQYRREYREAAADYREAGKSIPVNLAKEFLSTAKGFAAIDNYHREWREILSAKLEDSGVPEVHRALAARLAAEGDTALSLQEAEIANLLESGK